MSNNKLSLQLNIDDFLPASDEEKESLTVLRKSVGFWQDGIRRLKKNKIAMVSLVVIIFVFASPYVGRSPSFRLRTYIRIVQITKLGIAIPHVLNTIMMSSTIVPRLKAAILPNGTPTRTAVKIAMPPTLADTGNFDAMIMFTVRPLCFTLRPRFP